MIISLIGHCALPDGIPGDSRDRLHAIGVQLRDVGNLPAKDFVQYVNHALRSDWTRLFRSTQISLAGTDSRALAWRQDLERILATLLEALKQPDAWIPLEFSDLPPELALVRTQVFVRRTAQLLGSWEHIVGAAARLAESGIRPSRTVE